MTIEYTNFEQFRFTQTPGLAIYDLGDIYERAKNENFYK